MLPLVIALTSLLALQLVVVKGRSTFSAVIPSIFAALLAGALLIGAWLGPPRYLPSASTSGLVVHVSDEIRAALRDGVSEIIIIDGGSYTARGVDDRIVERSLKRKLGRSIKVISISLPGGNQIERSVVLKHAIGLLDEEELGAFRDVRKTFLLEVHSQYDRVPFNQLRKNRFTDRAYAYIDYSSIGDTQSIGGLPSAVDNPLRYDLDVLSHAFLNVFNYGRANRVTGSEGIAPLPAYRPLSRPAKGYKFRGMRKVIAELESPVPTSYDLPLESIERRRERLVEALGDSMPVEYMYYSVPTPRLDNLQYARRFCEEVRGTYGCIAHEYAGLLRKLNHRRFWYDDGHMRLSGAKIFSRWLSGRVVREYARDRSAQ